MKKTIIAATIMVAMLSLGATANAQSEKKSMKKVAKKECCMKDSVKACCAKAKQCDAQTGATGQTAKVKKQKKASKKQKAAERKVRTTTTK